MQNNLIINKSFGEYRLDKILGETDFSQSFLAYREGEADPQKLSLRRFHRKISSDDNFLRYSDFVMNVLKLLDHPAILPIFDQGKLNDHYYYTRSYIEGFSVADMLDHSLRGEVRLGGALTAAVITQVLDALAYTNSVQISNKLVGITHSNLSPSNIFLIGEGQLVLTDFRPPFTRPDLLREFHILPEVRISPEMVGHKPVTEKSDVFLVGLLIYELIYHEPLYTGLDSLNTLKAELDRKIPLKNEPPVDAPQNINRIIATVLDISSKQRLKSFRALSEFLQAEWLGMTVERSKELLKEYYSKLSADTVHDIIEDFKEEIEDTLGLMNFDDKRDDDLESSEEGDEITTVDQSPPRHYRLDYEKVGIQDYVALLANIKKTLKIKPTNGELLKSALSVMDNIDRQYKIYSYFQQADQAREQGSTIQAAVFLLSILSLEKENDIALQQLHTILHDSETHKDEVEPDEQKVLSQGMQLFQEQKYHEAIEELRKISQASSIYRQAKDLIDKAKNQIDQQAADEYTFQQGLAYVEEKKYELAIQQFTKVLSSTPNYLPAIEAIENAQEKLVDQQQTIHRLMEEASELVSQGQLAAAISKWEMILQLDPENQKAQDYIYETKQTLNKEASPHIENILQQAEKYLAEKRYESALEEWRRALELDPTRVDIEQKMKNIRDLLETKELVKTASQPIASESKPAEKSEKDLLRSYLDEGLQCYGAGDYESAIKIWQNVLDIDSKHEQAIEYIELAKEELGDRKEIVPESVDLSSEGVPVQAPSPEDAEEQEALQQRREQEEMVIDDDLPELATDEDVVEDKLVVQETEYSQHTDEFEEESTDRIDISALEAEDDLPELELTDQVVSEDTPEAAESVTDEQQVDTIALEGSEQVLEEGTPDQKELKEEEPEKETIHIIDEQQEIDDLPVEKAQTLDEDVDEIFERGLDFYEEKNYERAIKQWSEALKLKPDHKKSKIFLEKAKAKLSTTLEVIEEASEVTEKKKKTKTAFFATAAVIILVISVLGYFGWSAQRTKKKRDLALQNFSSQNYTAAIPHFEQYLQSSPSDTQALEKLGISYMQLNQPQQAIVAFNKLITLKKQNTTVLTYLGQAYFRNQEFQKAHDTFLSASNLDPKNNAVLIGLAKTESKIGQHSSALKRYQLVRKRSPMSMGDEEQMLLAESLLATGEYETSLSTFQRVKQPSFEQAFGVGRCYFKLGQFEQAAEWFAKANEFDEQSVENRLFLGKNFYRLKQYQAAIDEYLSIIQEFPDDLDVYLELGTAYLKLGKHDEALTSYRKALEYHPDNAKLHFSIGVAYHGKGDDEKAIEEYQRAIDLRENYAEVLANLGIIYFSKNDREAAKGAWFASLKANPDQPQIQKYLRRLGIR